MAREGGSHCHCCWTASQGSPVTSRCCFLVDHGRANLLLQISDHPWGLCWLPGLPELSSGAHQCALAMLASPSNATASNATASHQGQCF